MSDQLIIEAAS